MYLLLAGAILSEVTATIALRLSDGFTRLVPSVVVVGGYILAFGLLGAVLKRGLGLGLAYALWAACGVALVAVIGALAFGDGLTWVQIVGVALVIAGVVALELGAAH